ncbi:RRQRL motif-containing zinc-binding protein [Streptomyces sp. TG1A-8]|uniref:RRQRL motif-containing zinc-binding protein n=1 Tax=Streptomyces sp. TG1A-8 TaxID=3051385 RepID=UPI00265C0BDA|nr:RRQRL motif-containing zinc-binding protein [Streptomyces sp. TG1A-8]MDO0929760.1 RRQRL motif-containing zinc-binding protein [Streptomyces sp. TG1A-8]
MTTRARRRRPAAQPRATHGLPEYDWGTAPTDQLATRRQLRADRLRPGGQEPAAILRCRACATRPQRTCTRPAYLYRRDLALPIRPMTLAKEAALDKAMAARTTCPACLRRYHHCLPLRTLGSCLECFDGTPADPATYTAPPAHALAA